MHKLVVTISAMILAIHASSVSAEDLDLVKLKQQLIKHEGKKHKVYKDTEGIPTIGVGFNLTRSDAKAKITALGHNYDKILAGEASLTDEQIDKLLTDDINASIVDSSLLVTDAIPIAEPGS